MKKLIIVYIVLIVAVILLAVVRGGGNLLSFIPVIGGGTSATAEVGGNTLKLIVAKSEQDRMKGLSGRKSLPQDTGMLFVFEKKDRPGFWMKDMMFPIDIIYIDDTKVVYVVRNAPSSVQSPNLTVYRPESIANYVLEVNAGVADKLKIKEGTTIKLTNVK